MTDKAIVAEDLTYRYGTLTAVDHISFEVETGQVLGFLGPNGAGKSTTIQMLTGQLRPAEGHATLLGLDIARASKRVQAQIGVSFEVTNLYEEMTAEENLTLFARLFGVRGFDAHKLLERVGLGGRGKERVAGYSKGMKQRLMVARSLINQPRILFLDEPTEGLDPNSAQAIRTIVREEQARGATIFLTTHDMMEADKLSDRVAFINQGKIAVLDTPRNLKQRYGRRMMKAEVAVDGRLETHEVALDRPETAEQIEALFRKGEIVTVHSEEATLEDIFIQLTGRELVG